MSLSCLKCTKITKTHSGRGKLLLLLRLEKKAIGLLKSRPMQERTVRQECEGIIKRSTIRDMGGRQTALINFL